MPPGSQFRLRLRRRIEKLRGTIFSFKKHTKDGRCFWAEYFFEVFWRLLLKPKSRKNISSKVGKISNYRPVEGLNSKVRPGLVRGSFWFWDFVMLALHSKHMYAKMYWSRLHVVLCAILLTWCQYEKESSRNGQE